MLRTVISAFLTCLILLVNVALACAQAQGPKQIAISSDDLPLNGRRFDLPQRPDFIGKTWDENPAGLKN